MPTLRRTLLAAALVMPAPSPVLALIDSVDLEPGGVSTLSLTVVQSYDDVPSPGCLALPITLTLHEGPAILVLTYHPPPIPSKILPTSMLNTRLCIENVYRAEEGRLRRQPLPKTSSQPQARLTSVSKS
jgi:hypothetical protein